MKMPQLTFVRFDDMEFNLPCKTDDESEQQIIKMDDITIIEYVRDDISYGKEWFTSWIRELNYVIVSFNDLCSLDKQLFEMNRIMLSQVVEGADYKIETSLLLDSQSFGELQHINLNIKSFYSAPEKFADKIMNILDNFKSVKVLFIYFGEHADDYSFMTYLDKFYEGLDLNEISKDYQMKNSQNYMILIQNNIYDSD
ncbi:hypothetical protein I4U23_004775 [Adineta vaga]|nr:hypothetical protein I4U23_004775 [Adineta vaga]